MSFLKIIYERYLSKLNKYGVVIIVFLIVTFIIGDSNLVKRHQYDEKIRVLEKEIKYYKNEIENDQKKLDDLNTNKERLERFAREEYFMKKPDEDIFIIEYK
jgi:Septum formation initiator